MYLEGKLDEMRHKVVLKINFAFILPLLIKNSFHYVYLFITAWFKSQQKNTHNELPTHSQSGLQIGKIKITPWLSGIFKENQEKTKQLIYSVVFFDNLKRKKH